MLTGINGYSYTIVWCFPLMFMFKKSLKMVFGFWDCNIVRFLLHKTRRYCITDFIDSSFTIQPYYT